MVKDEIKYFYQSMIHHKQKTTLVCESHILNYQNFKWFVKFGCHIIFKSTVVYQLNGSPF
jgi:protein-arginine kinase activator protein McsA